MLLLLFLNRVYQSTFLHVLLVGEMIFMYCYRSHHHDLWFLSPWRIVDDCGGAFTMGAIGGGIFQAVKGFRNSPSVSDSSSCWYSDTVLTACSTSWLQYNVIVFCFSSLQGMNHRMRGSLTAIRTRAPQLGGNVKFKGYLSHDCHMDAEWYTLEKLKSLVSVRFF